MSVTANEMKIVLETIGNMNNDDLATVVERIKLQRTWITNQQVRSIVVNDTVSFFHKSQKLVGKVTKVNRKTVMVAVKDAYGTTNWKVPASMLTKEAG